MPRVPQARAEKFSPFCSRRCADVDLNRWLRGVYAVPVTGEADEDGTGSTARMDSRRRSRSGSGEAHTR